jgi:hypothetical protein
MKRAADDPRSAKEHGEDSSAKRRGASQHSSSNNYLISYFQHHDIRNTDT